MTHCEKLEMSKIATMLRDGAPGRGQTLARAAAGPYYGPAFENVASELQGHGGVQPMVMAAQLPPSGPISHSYRNLLAARLRQFRLQDRAARGISDWAASSKRPIPDSHEAMRSLYQRLETAADQALTHIRTPAA